MIKDDNQWKMDYKFEKDGKYSFEIHFSDVINNMNKFFQDGFNIISLDFPNFDTLNVISMHRMFHECKNLKEIKGLNIFNTYNVTNMCAMFQRCYEIDYLDLSNFDTSNVTNIGGMFNDCMN